LNRARLLRLLYLALGLSAIVWIAGDLDLGAVGTSIARIQPTGWFVVFAVYTTAFFVDSLSWLLTVQALPFRLANARRLFLVRFAGEAFNTVLPAAGIGGEPLKVALLHHRYGVGLEDAGASVVLARTINLLALVLFLGIGFALSLRTEELPREATWLAAIGLAALAGGTAGFYVLQRHGLASRAAQQLKRRRRSSAPDGAIARSLRLLEILDARFASFYLRQGRDLAAAFALALLNWMLGALEIYLVLHFLGHPVSIATAWVIEAAAQMVRAAAFFIPAAIGAQEGVFVYLCDAVTGVPALGLAAALVRRARELAWVVLGMLCAWALGLRQTKAASR